MWHPVYIKGQNWCSFKNLHIVFKKGSPHLILGENNQDSEQESNGSGKSSLVEHPYFLLLGDSMRGVVDTSLINNNESVAEIEGEFFNSFLKQKLFIQRTLSRSSSSKLVIKLDDIPQKFSSVPEGNKLILSLIGISKEDIQNYYLLNREKYTSFFKISDREKKGLISRFSSYDKINGIDLVIQSKIDTFEADKKTKEKLVVQLQSQKSLLQLQIDEELSKDLEVEKTTQIKSVEERIERSNKSIERLELSQESKLDLISEKKKSIELDKIQLKSIQDSIKLTETQLVDIDLSIKSTKSQIKTLQEGVDKVNLLVSSLDKASSDLDKSILEIDSLLLEINTILSGTITCPSCKFEFLKSEEISLDEAKESLKPLEDTKSKNSQSKLDLSVKRKSHKDSIKDTLESIQTLEKSLSEFSTKQRDLSSEKSRLDLKVISISQSIKTAESMITTYQIQIKNDQESVLVELESIESLKLQIENIKKSDNIERDLRIEKLRVQIVDYDAKLVLAEESVLDVETTLQKYVEWELRFKKFKSYLANQSLGILQKFSNLYLKKMKTPFSIKFEGYKVLSDKKIKESITPFIFRNGFLEGEFKKLSGGERAKVDLSFILTAQKLINSSVEDLGLGLDLLIVDEILDSTDSKGITSVIASLAEINRTLWLITHIPHSNNQINIIKVIKDEAGISTVVQN